MWIIAVQGARDDFVRNIEANPVVRLRYRGRWDPATASIHPMNATIVAQFSL
jgi:hypothetical protein